VGAGPGAGSGAAGRAGAGWVPDGTCVMGLRFFFLQRLRERRRRRCSAAVSALGFAETFLLRFLTGAQPGLGLRRLRLRLAVAVALTSL